MFEIKTLKDGLKKIAPRTKTKAITDDANKNLDTILSEKANSADVPSKVSQLTNDTGFITNAALANYPNNTQMNAAINAHHDSTKQDKLAAQTPYTNVGSKNKIPKITTNALGQVTNVEEVDVEVQSVSLNQNLAYVNDNDTSIVTNVSDDLLLNDGATYIEARKSTDVISNGLLSSAEKAIARFSKDYFNIKNNNEVSLDINKVLAKTLLLDGSNVLYEPVNNLNNFSTGIGLFHDVENRPFKTTFLVLSGSHVKNGALIQLALNYNGELVYRSYNIDTKVWKNWGSLFINDLASSSVYKGLSANQGRILNEKITAETNRATGAESTLTTDLSNEVTRAKAKENELDTKFANYLLKSDAPGYADILTKTLASATYETIENASNYVAKGEAVGYDDILTNANATATYETKANATATYETKANATETYETKANASATYVSKSEAVGYDDILTSEQANNTYANKNIEIYDESEKLIGTFMGANLYRKLVKYAGDFKVGVTNIPHNVTSLERCVKSIGLRKTDNTQFPYIDGSNTLNIEKVNETNISVRCSGENWSQSLWYFIIEYTKEQEVE